VPPTVRENGYSYECVFSKASVPRKTADQTLRFNVSVQQSRQQQGEEFSLAPGSNSLAREFAIESNNVQFAAWTSQDDGAPAEIPSDTTKVAVHLGPRIARPFFYAA
jgi:hypothetical protein